MKERTEVDPTVDASADHFVEEAEPPELDRSGRIIEKSRFPKRYVRPERLGGGGQGTVYKAFDNDVGHDVALKVVDRGRARRVEANALRLISEHEHIVAFYDLHDGWLSMELIDGVNLRDFLRDGPLDYELAIECVVQIAAAVEYAHGHGVVHRDLKPSNVMVVAKKEAASELMTKVLDFGLAHLSHAKHDRAVGTPGYAAPEQERGDEVDARCDIWAIGGILYEVLTGRMAWEETRRRKVPQLPEDPWGRHRVIQPILDRTLVERDARYPSATALREALEGAQGACERESLRSRLARINAVFQPDAHLVHVPEPVVGVEPFRLEVLGALEITAVEERVDVLDSEFNKRRRRGERAINDAHAVVDLLASDLTADPPRFSYRTTDYHAIRALRERFVQPRILSASAVIVLPGAKQVVLHRRSPSSATYPSALHTFGGAFKPEVIDDAWDRSLEDAICREFTEESGIDRARAHGLDSVHRCPKLIALEPPTGFVQVVYLGLAIDKVAFRPNWEGKEVCLSYDELATELIDPRGWVPTGLVHVLAWLAAGAPGAGRDASFDGRSARELADLILDTMQLRAKAARGR